MIIIDTSIGQNILNSISTINGFVESFNKIKKHITPKI